MYNFIQVITSRKAKVYFLKIFKFSQGTHLTKYFKPILFKIILVVDPFQIFLGRTVNLWTSFISSNNALSSVLALNLNLKNIKFLFLSSHFIRLFHRIHCTISKSFVCFDHSSKQARQFDDFDYSMDGQWGCPLS